MAVSHVKSITLADFTGTVTAFNSAGSTTTVAASDLGRPSDWNSAHNQLYTLTGNTTQGSTASGTNVVFSGAGAVSVGGTGATVIISGPDIRVERRYKEIIPGERMTTIAGLSNTAYSRRPLFQPFWVEGTGMEAKTVRFIASFGASSNRSLIGTFHVGLYSYANATNSTLMTLLGEDTISFSSTNTANSGQWNGIFWMDFTGLSAVTIANEGRHLLAFMVRPNAADVSNMPVTIYGADNMPAVRTKIGQGGTTSINGTEQQVPWWGAYTTTTAALPASLAISQVSGGSSVSQLEIYAVIKEL